MTLKDFCLTLQTCAEKLDNEIRCNINEFNNKMFGKEMNETRLALERAKDYHYKEIVDALTEIVKHVNVILFHQEKIEWLSNERNFSEQDLKRFSYVKRQVYAFSKQQQPAQPTITRSVEDLSETRKIRKEKRRTVSEVSVGTLEAWERYLDQKEERPEETPPEIKKTVARRTLSNARARKKFVSSTLGGFLDDDFNKRKTLDSIEEYNVDESSGFLEESLCCNGSCDNLVNPNDDSSGCEVKIDEEDVKTNLVNAFENSLMTNNDRNSSEEYINIIPDEFFDDVLTVDIDLPRVEFVERIKPRIVDVIYKKKIPSICCGDEA